MGAARVLEKFTYLRLVKHSGERRFVELDALRGLAIILMIGFHLTHDLRVFGAKNLVSWLAGWYWQWFPEFIGVLFFLVVGISVKIKFERMETPELKPFLRQSLKIGVAALVVSAVSYFATPDQFIYFGVLHCIAVCSALVYPFLRYPRICLTLGILLAGIGFVLEQNRFNVSGLMWLGFAQPNSTGGDWYPLLPWFGVTLLGLAAAVKWNDFVERFPDRIRRHFFIRKLSFLGRHSLVIYLLHQPVMIGLLSLLGVIRF